MKEEEEGENTKGITLIDFINGFNKLSRLAMIWTVMYLWPPGARFSFNCYRHEALLAVRRPDALCHIITSKEGFTQGEPL